MSWLSASGTFVAALLVLLVPGALAAVALRTRGFTILALAGPLSIAMIAAGSLLQMVLPFVWGVPAWIVTVALGIGVAALVGWWRRKAIAAAAAREGWRQWLPFATAAVAAVVLIPRLLVVFGAPDDISQTFDNIYHLNAVRYELDTGTIAPTRQIIPGFYPSLWHAATATVALLSGGDVAVAVTMTSIVLAALVWPISCVWLVRQIVGSSVVAIAVAGPLSVAFAAFPLLMLDFGVLYPNVMSIALLPAALAALIAVCGLGRGPRPEPVTRWMILLILVGTLALAHPSTLMAFFAIGFWPSVWAGIRWFRRDAKRPVGVTVLVIALWVVGLVTAALLLWKARPTRDQAFWLPSTGKGEAIVQVLANAPAGRPWAWVVSALVVAGIVTILLVRRRDLWLVFGWGTIAVIYVVCASVASVDIRYYLTGTWYSDVNRIAALLPAVALPLAAIGAWGIAVALGILVRRTKLFRITVATRIVGAVAAALGLLLVTQFGPSMRVATASAAGTYVMNSSSALLTPDERALIDRLPSHVGPDDVIVGSPWTGTSLSYALADRKALIPHIYQVFDDDMDVIAQGLNNALIDPGVCEALARTNTRWYLDFGAREVHGAIHDFPGFDGLAASDVVQLVDSEGPDARLYRIVACD